MASPDALSIAGECWKYCVLNHAKFGASSFLQVAIGVNFAVKGISFFRNWFEHLSTEMFERRYTDFVAILDRTRDLKSPSSAIRKKISHVQNINTSVFHIFWLLSWASILYGIGALYIDFAHCGNLAILLVWPTYAAVVWAVVFFQSRKIFKQLQGWKAINDHDDKGDVSQAIGDLKKKLEKEDSEES